jgi:hypothetical protein
LFTGDIDEDAVLRAEAVHRGGQSGGVDDDRALLREPSQDSVDMRIRGITDQECLDRIACREGFLRGGAGGPAE